MDNEYWLNLCKDIGEKAFSEAQRYLKKDERKKVMSIGYGGDKTLFLDDVIEKLIINEFKSTGKSFKLITEELGIKTFGENPQIIVVVDPIDGSNNMRFGLPFVSTSIAVGDLTETMKGIEVGYVKNLINGDDYYAVKGKGAFKNEIKIHVSEDEIGCVIVDIVKNRETNFKRIADFGKKFPFVRMLGSCCLGQCFVAEGAIDGYVGLNAKRTIDQTATQLIVREAGGLVKDLQGNDFREYKIEFNIDYSTISASNDSIYKKILTSLK